MAHDNKHKKKLQREKKRKMERHYKVTKKNEGISDVEVKKGRWLMYFLATIVAASTAFFVWNLK